MDSRSTVREGGDIAGRYVHSGSITAFINILVEAVSAPAGLVAATRDLLLYSFHKLPPYHLNCTHAQWFQVTNLPVNRQTTNSGWKSAIPWLIWSCVNCSEFLSGRLPQYSTPTTFRSHSIFIHSYILIFQLLCQPNKFSSHTTN